MFDISKIKLIIWDLDETFWQGTITEGNIEITPETIDFLNNTLDMGIVHSICSKNDFDVVENELTKRGLWDKFVFPSINWTAKGARIKDIIEKMALRACNVLFVDDNIQNLKEAEFYCDGIITALPDAVKELYATAKEAIKTDIKHKRLNQYKILEQKNQAKKEFSSNESFLMSCGIRVNIEKKCVDEIDRIHELLMRSNQLNYTKFRQDKDELKKLLEDNSVDAGIVKVKDNFGDYGIVGFFALKENKAIHFLFSCRTLGMLVEQYVYKTIGCPEIDVVGDVVTVLNNNDLPKWINQKTTGDEKTTLQKDVINKKVLFKGPCDLLQVFSFIKKAKNIVTEFSYTNNDGIFVEGQNTTGSISSALTISQSQKAQILSEFSWIDKDFFETSLRSEKYDTVVLSLLADSNLGCYKHKETGVVISLCEGYYPLTKEENHKGYIDGSIYSSNINFTKEELNKFCDKYTFVSDENLTIRNLDDIYGCLSGKTKLVLILGSEKPCNKDKRESYHNRHIVHTKVNKKVLDWARNKENVVLINLTEFVESENDYTDSINHFTKEVYYKLAQEIVSLINDDLNVEIKHRSYIFISKLKDKINKLLGR